MRSLEHFSQNLIPSFVCHQAFTAKLKQHLASTQTNSQTKEKQELYQAPKHDLVAEKLFLTASSS